ncbi:MAG: 2'-5' RNA ligase family protein [Sphingomonadaceae bacterium]|nr:2'-5' RNA ligase family protein [Sphingomonadaceae bacterium]
MRENAPIIVTALFGDEDFAWLDGLRRAHYPPGRNIVPAHLTLFHHLPPSIAPELKQRLIEETRDSTPPSADIYRVRHLGKGVAFDVQSPELAAIRERLAEAFTGLLTPQDSAGWNPHITIQNKVEPAASKTLHAELSADFEPRPLRIAGLASHYYRGGPWDPIAQYKFRR